MLEMICAIPENVGWVIVGAFGMLTVIMACVVGKIIIQAIKYRIEERKFWQVRHCEEGNEW